ncbi:hypothetical protein [Veillonella sp. AF36-20BH]|jgi:hypothetical protein|uniref:hypothetical protein n=1 Tax=Veillonella sp. AF36-20BH TaxID=2293251 RepID=UPI000E740B2B|nr:hypothetical protein [Veillonella sp. AF36-20BH]RJU18398.1 hypothetical protein DW000_00720 [Veillonella sp. AF36-20BH]
MKAKYKEIQKEMINITLATYLFTFLFAGIFFIIIQDKGETIGATISGIIFWLGYALIRYINKRQSTKFFEKLETRERYAIQFHYQKKK